MPLAVNRLLYLGRTTHEAEEPLFDVPPSDDNDEDADEERAEVL